MSIIQQQMFDAVTYSTSSNGSIGSLRSLGITMNDDGTLSVDSGQLTSALSSNNAAVQNFFSSAGAGFADKFAASLQSMTDPTQGAVSLEIQGNNSSVTSIQKQIADFEVRMATVQTMLTAQYDQMNVTLQQMPLLLGQVNSQLSSLG
jgi:flagellar hook-associated protein 2